MIQYLCDTNIISELTKSQPDIGVKGWASSVKAIALSIITVEELYYGLTRKPNAKIEKYIETFLSEYTEILPVTASIAKKAGIVRGQLQKKGITRTQADMFIAATALEHSLTLVTRNTKDFEGCGIALLNPFRK